MINDSLNRVEFMNRIVKDFMRMITKGASNLESTYMGYKMLVENQIKKDPTRKDECEELLNILEKAYRTFSDAEMVDIILKNNVTDKQFILRYGEKILGDNKRKYDMSDKFNPSLISLQDKRGGKRQVGYQAKEGKEYTYLDAEGKKVSIQGIGRLVFRHWNGLGDELSKYKITRQLNGDIYQVNEVISNIIIAQMDNPKYREAVLEELLSRNNIQLSKAGGYIGEIENVTIKDKDFTEGSERTISGDDYYRINQDYMLAYHAEAVTAAMLQEAQNQTKRDARTTNGYKNGEDRKVIEIMRRRPEEDQSSKEVR